MFTPHQVLHRNQILATGVSSRGLTELVRVGAVTRLWRGYYTTGAAVALPDPRGVTRSMRVVLSHESAAAWAGAELLNPVECLHVTAPRSRGRRVEAAPGLRLHRCDIDPRDIRWIRGVPVTSPERTVADLARSSGLAAAVAVADSYLRRRDTSPALLGSFAEALPKGPGRPAARRAALLVDARAGSVFESFTRVSLVEAGLPVPRTQFTVRDRSGRWIARVDFAWPSARLILECDGFEYHSSRTAFEQDRRRWAALTRAGWRVVTVTWAQVVFDPTYVVELVADLLGVPVRSSTQLATYGALTRAS